jgi:FMN phosphatase YigB (HAD superfamily)
LIKAVLFDLDGTLLNRDESVTDVWTREPPLAGGRARAVNPPGLIG